MEDSVRKQLVAAYEFVKAGQKKDARAILVPIVKVDRSNADAWWLLANAMEKDEDVRQALKQVLRLKPGHTAAKKMLAALDDSAAQIADDPFGDLAEEEETRRVRHDPAFDVLQRKPLAEAEAQRRSSQSSNKTLLIGVSIAGVLALCACVACLVINVIMPLAMVPALASFSGELEQQNRFTIDEMMRINEYGALPEYTDMGDIMIGETRTAHLDFFEEQSYWFVANAGETIVISMRATNSTQELDPFITLYDAVGFVLANDDDSGGGLNAELVFQLPEAGLYKIGAGSYSASSSGAYEIRVARR